MSDMATHSLQRAPEAGPALYVLLLLKDGLTDSQGAVVEAARLHGLVFDHVRELSTAVESARSERYDVCLVDRRFVELAPSRVRFLKNADPTLAIAQIDATGLERNVSYGTILRAPDLFSLEGMSGQGLAVTLHALSATRRAERQLEVAEKRLGSNLEQLVALSNTMLAQRDPYASTHQQRVAETARLLASAMTLGEERVERIVTAARVIDIGNIGVSIDILNKPSALTSIELDLVRQHVEIGRDILLETGFQRAITEIVYQHHERLDGSGYPRGLRGGEVLVEARVLAVADAYEAMRAHRPFRRAFEPQKAMEVLRSQGERHYDERVLEGLGAVVAAEQVS